MENSISSRRDLITAMFTSVNLAFLDAVKFRIPSTTFAGDNFWIKITTKPIKTSIVIGKHFSKILYGELLHLLFTCFHGIYIIAQNSRVVKGYSPKILYLYACVSCSKWVFLDIIAGL